MTQRFVHFQSPRLPGRATAIDIARHTAPYSSDAAPMPSEAPLARPGAVISESDLAIHAMEFVRCRFSESADTPRQRVLERCISFLMNLAYISQARAETLAATALGEFESARAGVSFDVDRSTSYVVFLHDPSTRALRAVTAAELLQLLHPTS